MDHKPHTNPTTGVTLRRLTEHVTIKALDGEAEQGLLDAAMELGAVAASIWRPLTPSTGGCESWHPVRSRGDSRALPPNTVVQAHFEGRLACTLPSGALALGGLLEGIGLVVGEPATGLEQAPSDDMGLSSADHSERWRTDCGNLLEALLVLAGQLGIAAETDPEGLARGPEKRSGTETKFSGLVPEPGQSSDQGPDRAA